MGIIPAVQLRICIAIPGIQCKHLLMKRCPTRQVKILLTKMKITPEQCKIDFRRDPPAQYGPAPASLTHAFGHWKLDIGRWKFMRTLASYACLFCSQIIPSIWFNVECPTPNFHYNARFK